MNTNTMYATRKRRKPIQKRVKPPAEGAKSNPSKRHRERLNGELEHLANLLPFSQDVISKLDKLTVLRLSVSYLRAKSFFNVTPKSDSCPKPDGNGQKLGEENFLEGELLLQVLNGFVLVASSDGVVFYVSSTIQEYLGFHQSDIIHQNVYDLIHTEDRSEFRRQLHWALDPTVSPETGQESSDGRSAELPLACYRPEQLPPENSTFLDRNFVCRVRCLLDNSSGFLAMNFQGRLKFLHAQNQRMKDGLPAPPPLALFAIVSPLQPPSILEIRTKSFMFRTKHKLDFTPTACDDKGKTVLGYTEAELCYRGTGYQFIHAADMLHCAENHIRMMKTGESGMTVFRLLTKQSGWVWVQANARLVYKNGKPECIIASQCVITDEEGEENLSKRNLKLPFGFTTGEAVLYDTNGLLMEGDSSQSNGTRSLDPNSLLGAMLKQDESAYVCVPAQNPVSFQHSALADSGEDQILSGDWQDDILSLSENGIFKQKPISGSEEDKNGDLLNFMKGLGISREDLELIQKDEEFLQIRLDEQGDIMDVADEILSYVQESLKTSDFIFSNSTERKLSGQDSSCAPQSQQPHLVPHLQHEQPLLQPLQDKPVLQQHLHTQMHPQQTFPQQYLHTQAHPHQPIPQQHPHAQTEQLISQQHPQTQQLISEQNPHAQTKQLISQQHPQTQQLISQKHPQTQQLSSQQHPQTQQLISQQNPHAQTGQLISQHSN
ncbi:aryl hydrocarbon receptor 1a [Anguilla anguilla]|uniref:aryl hydrocarbon receptor 1a n=1 Tax=Anguilla anguilla TaxID=7936 RepID=UPI0015AFAC7D|nr:aryl hydrocarbon receptor 1a [Anguilla anguilla]